MLIQLMKIVEIFRTDIQCPKEAEKVINLFLALYPVFKINIDLEDEENILRIESYGIKTKINQIADMMGKLGHYCERLD